jgi:prepilin-type N-terminal cleavage/methylation domain-containing protein
MRRTRAHSQRSGFTLLEMLAVMVILSILVVFLAFRLGGLGESAKARLTATYLNEISLAVAEYEHEHGDYPPSEWDSKWGAQPNKKNAGIEILCVTLWSPKWGGVSLSEDKLDNTDGDRSKQSLTTHANRDLFELVDAWQNPIAYFHRRDYGREDLYITIDEESADWTESTIKAYTNPKTGNYFRSRTFQLISAGQDGVFGTKDDLSNFERGDG